MTNTERLFNLAEISLASYGTLLTGNTTSAANIDALQIAGMSAQQAADFAKRFPDVVLPTHHDSTSDLDVTVFKDAGGNLTLGIRGTLPGHDLTVTDVQIALHGAGYDQIVALYNWWQRMSKPAGSSVGQFALAEYPNAASVAQPAGAVKLYDTSLAFGGQSMYLSAAPAATATGELTAALAADPDRKIDVTGHSLGAHLALAFNALFAPSVGQAAGFDTPGFLSSPVNQQFFAALGGAVPTAANSGNFFNVIADEASVGDKPFNAIAGVHSRPGVLVDISIENQWLSDEPLPEAVRNHSMKMLADSLAVYSLLGTLDPRLDTATYRALMNAAANGSAASYERIVDALEAVLGLGQVPLGVGNAQRDGLYTALYGLRDSVTFKALAGKVAVTVNSKDFAATARTEFTALAGLLTLSPLALKPVGDAGKVALDGLWQTTAWNDTYLQWLSDGSSAALGNPAEFFTDSWIADRSTLLDTLVRANQANESFYNDRSASDVWVYEDKATNTLITRQPAGPGPFAQHYVSFGSEANEFLAGGNLADRLYGGGGLDQINGGDGDDYIEGGAEFDSLYGEKGNDTLAGGAEGDWLDGGQGNDTLRGGTGSDTLRGQQGVDLLYGGGDADTLDGGESGDFLYGGFGTDTYAFTGAFGSDLVFDDDGDGVIEVDGQRLDGAGTKKLRDGAFSDDTWLYTLMDNGRGTQDLTLRREGSPNTIRISDWSRQRSLGITLSDTPADAHTVASFIGDFDKATNQEGTAFLLGPDGNYVSAGQKPGAADLITGSGSADAISGLGGDDALLGRGGDDHIDGGEGNDILMGGLGADTLIGGAGRDLFYGSSTGSLDYPVSTDFEQPQPTLPVLLGLGFGWVWESSGPDEDGLYSKDLLSGTVVRDTRSDDDGNVLDGGAGEDFILAGTGADVAHGGPDADEIFGMAGSDSLYGDAGADRIYGDGPVYDGFLHSTAAALHGVAETLVDASGLPHAKKLLEGIYQSADKQVTYTWVHDSAEQQDSVIRLAGNVEQGTVQNWSTDKSFSIARHENLARGAAIARFIADHCRLRDAANDGFRRAA